MSSATMIDFVLDKAKKRPYKIKEIIEELSQSSRILFPLVRRFTFENRLKTFELNSLLFFFGLLTTMDTSNEFNM